MVNRASDNPSGIVETVKDVRARAEENARRLGRGAAALRNSQGQAFEIDPGSGVPLLVPYADGGPTGSALKFTANGVEIVDPIDGERRDVLARDLTLTRHINIGGDVRAAKGIRAEEGLSTGGDMTADGGIRAELGLSCGGTFAAGTRARSPNWSSSLQDGALRWRANGAGEFVSYDGSAMRDCWANAFGDSLGNVRNASERHLKDHVADIEPGQVDSWRPALFTWKPDVPQATANAAGELDDRVHAAVYVDELDGVPGAVLGRDSDGNRVPDPTALIAYLVAEVQDLRRRVALLEEAAPARG